jgi:polyphosphate kinase
LTPQQTLDAIATRVRHMVTEQYRCYRDDIVPSLAANGIDFATATDLAPAARQWVEEYFRREVFPVLTPLAIDPAHPFPQLLNKSLNLAVLLCVATPPAEAAGADGKNRKKRRGAALTHQPGEDMRLGVVQVPRVLPRLVPLPAAVCPEGRRVYVFQSSIISAYIGELYTGLDVAGCYAFRVTRNSELYLDEDEADNLLEAMQEQLQRRRRGDAVRLEVQRGCDPAVVEMLLRIFELEPMDLYEVDGPINLTRLMSVYAAETRPDLKEERFTPAIPPALRHIETADDMFAAIRQNDILLHHPYESFRPVSDFITMAAEDPQVLAIKQTLYRTSTDSSIVRALMRAAECGKQVTALVELKARFDEENNILWARAMEEAGVHVLYGLVGLKTHCKLALVVRREDSEIRRYVHLGTGNYNEITARLYTDTGMLTARPEVGEDAAKIFNLLTGMSQFPGLLQLMMAPFGLHEQFLHLIERETAHALKQRRHGAGGAADNGRRPRIIAKMNALEEPGIIKALYRASQAGVQVDLIVRGFCCLRPGVPGLSDNIRVRSIVDRFLEHSRIYYFANNGSEEIYCGSADWMERNFFRRVEVIFPVRDPALKTRLRDEILMTALRDNVKARLIQSDGTHRRVPRATGVEPLRLQQYLLEQAQRMQTDGAADFLSTRQAAAPTLLSQTPAVPAIRTLDLRTELTPRTTPPAVAPPAADGRAGTTGDPVLQTLRQAIATDDASLTGDAKALHEGERAQRIVVVVSPDETNAAPVAEPRTEPVQAEPAQSEPASGKAAKRAAKKQPRPPQKRR